MCANENKISLIIYSWIIVSFQAQNLWINSFREGQGTKWIFSSKKILLPMWFKLGTGDIKFLTEEPIWTSSSIEVGQYKEKVFILKWFKSLFV